MRRAGKLVAEVLDLLREAVRPGVSTGELDRMAEEHIRSCGAAPAFKGYRPAPSMSPFPGTICASINEEVVHGFPSEDRFLEEGDIPTWTRRVPAYFSLSFRIVSRSAASSLREPASKGAGE